MHMARKSALNLVLSQMIPVDPDGSQPAYYRSKRAVQTSSELISYQQCVADRMEGENFNSQSEVRDAFESAANSCS